MRPIVHPRMLTRLQAVGFFPDEVTIQQKTVSQGSNGEPTESWANLASHVNLSCNVVPETSQGSREYRRKDSTITKGTHRINLAAAYASITELMRAVIGSTNYDILQVIHDSQGVQTILIVELVR